MISLVYIFVISWLLLASLVERASLSLTLSEIPKTGFLLTWLNCNSFLCVIHENMVFLGYSNFTAPQQRLLDRV